MKIEGQFRKQIKDDILDIVERAIERKTTGDKKFSYEKKIKENPFGASLVPLEIWKSSAFERSFVTSFGTKGFENIALYVAQASELYSHTERNAEIIGNVDSNQLTTLSSILDELEHPDKKIKKKDRKIPNWLLEREMINNTEKGTLKQIKVVSDIYLIRKKDNKKIFFEIKSAKPNADQSRVSKQKLHKISMMKEVNNFEVFFAFPYNPYIERSKYAHSHVTRYFDVKFSPIIIMGKELWDYIGGEGTYLELIEICKELGGTTNDLIQKKYLDLDFTNNSENKKTNKKKRNSNRKQKLLDLS